MYTMCNVQAPMCRMCACVLTYCVCVPGSPARQTNEGATVLLQCAARRACDAQQRVCRVCYCRTAWDGALGLGVRSCGLVCFAYILCLLYGRPRVAKACGPAGRCCPCAVCAVACESAVRAIRSVRAACTRAAHHRHCGKQHTAAQSTDEPPHTTRRHRHTPYSP